MSATQHERELFLTNLQKANVVRLKRAELLQPVRKNDTPEALRKAAEYLREVPPELATLRLGVFLGNVRRWRRGSGAPGRLAHRAMAEVGVSEVKLLGQMTERQRLALVGRLEADARRREKARAQRQEKGPAA